MSFNSHPNNWCSCLGCAINWLFHLENFRKSFRKKRVNVRFCFLVISWSDKSCTLYPLEILFVKIALIIKDTVDFLSICDISTNGGCFLAKIREYFVSLQLNFQEHIKTLGSEVMTLIYDQMFKLIHSCSCVLGFQNMFWEKVKKWHTFIIHSKYDSVFIRNTNQDPIQGAVEHICGALGDLVPFAQFKKGGKHPRRSVTFSKVAGLLKVTLLCACFSRFLNCAYGTKSRNAPHMIELVIRLFSLKFHHRYLAGSKIYLRDILWLCLHSTTQA